MVKQISFIVSKEDHELIVQIAKRAEEMFKRFGLRPDFADLLMDITATHANGMPLQLKELLEAPKLDFSHDIGGIIKHINRKTGKLEGFFVPRYAQPKTKEKSNG